MLKQRTVFLSLSFLFFLHSIGLGQVQTPFSISLNSNWQFIPAMLMTPPNDTVLGQKIKQAGYDTQFPNSVLSILRENGAIEAAITSENVSRLQWLESKDWLFDSFFDIDEKTLVAEKIELVLRGVDTYAGVFLNDVFLFKANDKSKIWSENVKPLLKTKNNKLRIYFVSTERNSQLFKKSLNNATKSVQNSLSLGLQSIELQVSNAASVSVGYEKSVDNVTWRHRIENDSLKVVFKNERANYVRGYFYVDVYDLKGNPIFNDKRMMAVDAKSELEFYSYSLPRLLQGMNQANAVVVTTWKDSLNKQSQEIKKTFDLSKPSPENGRKIMATTK